MEWTIEKAKQKIKTFSKDTYQNIDLGDGVVVGHKNSTLGMAKWNFILKRNMPDLKGKRVLDAGCHAGVHSIEMCRIGAKEVIGIDIHAHNLGQAEFVKSYLEWKEKRKFPITYCREDIRDISVETHGKFDVILASNIVYHMRERAQELVNKFRQMSDCLVIAGRANVPAGTVGAMEESLYEAGYCDLSIDAPEGYWSPVIVARPITFDYKIIDIPLAEICRDSPHIPVIKEVLNKNIAVENSQLWKKWLVGRVHNILHGKTKDSSIKNLACEISKNVEKIHILYDSIKSGYLAGKYSYSYIVIATSKEVGEKRFIADGHHRAACLSALGIDSVKCCLLDEQAYNLVRGKMICNSRLAHAIKDMEGRNR